MLFPCFILLSVQEINQDLKEDRLNFMFPGCLFPFQDLICKLFAKEKSKFLANKCFNAVFSNTSLQPAFKNRQNIKNLVSGLFYIHPETVDVVEINGARVEKVYVCGGCWFAIKIKKKIPKYALAQEGGIYDCGSISRISD